MSTGRRVVLRPEVPDDLRAVVEYLERDSVEAADRFIENAFAAFHRIRDMPGVGSPKTFRRTGLKDVRSWAVPGFPNHLIYYQARPDAVVVLAVIHGARNVRAALRGRTP